MKKTLPRLESAEAVIHGVLKVRFKDGYEGVVDLRPLIDRQNIFSYLERAENFPQFVISEYGHSIGWVGNDGEEIDLSADNLRQKAESQAQLHKLVANSRW
jgi:Protein of unknown function (DUF2442)